MENEIIRTINHKTENISKSLPVYIVTNPNKILLIKVTDQNYYEGRIELKNITDNYAIYKFYINQNMVYSATPSVYFIKPHDSMIVNVKRFEKLSIDQLKTKETFLLTAMITQNKIEDVYIIINF